MTLTLAITNFNRFELLKQSYAQVLTDKRIDEILILDDASDHHIYEKVVTLAGGKVKVIRQAVNRGMQQNKADAIAYAKNEWVIIFDSDNVITPGYLDAIPDALYDDTIYMPSFARPEFNFKRYEGLLFDRVNVKQFIKDPPFAVLLNCCNYLTNRDAYGKVYKHNPEIDGADTAYFAHRWLVAGNSFYVVPGMEYTHRVHSNSGFLANIDKNMRDAEIIKKQIASL